MRNWSLVQVKPESILKCLAAATLAAVAATALADSRIDTESGGLIGCGLNPQARELAFLVINDAGQRRERLRCSPLLSMIAETKAREMAELGRVAHIGRSSANRRLISAGYALSEIYPRGMENNVEAIAGGQATAQEAWREFRNSEVHRMHLLGEHEFYLLQNELGVAYFRDDASPHVDYWVIYVAHKAGDRGFDGPVAASKD